MTRWEHRLLIWTPPRRRPAVPEDQAVTELLNRYGAKGWMLAHFVPPARGHHDWIFAFTRPSKEEA